MRGLIGRAVVGIAVAAGAGVLAAGMPTAAGAAGAAAVAARAPSADRGAAVVSGTWGTAQEVPGTASLNAGGSASVTSVSCATAGNCAAAGTYSDTAANPAAFVVTQTNGTWGTAKEVPGLAVLSVGDYAGGTSVSCGSAGDCSAGGFYQGGSGFQAFIVTQTNGIWGKAKEVPGTATLNTGENASVNAVSCATARNCSAAGYYGDASGRQVFVVTRTNGIWGTAEEVPGTASLNTGGYAEITSVSCAAANRCSAGGWYADGGYLQAFVVTES